MESGGEPLRTIVAALLAALFSALTLLQPLEDMSARQHDLRQIARTIEHDEWGLHYEPGPMAAFRRLAARDVALAAHPMPYWRYFGLAATLIASIRNPHTSIWPDVEERDFLPLAFYWAKDGLVTVPTAGSPQGIALGDRVLSIGGRTPAQLAQALSRYLPGNPYGVRYNACRFDLLSARYSLEWLGVVDSSGHVALTLENGQGRVENLSLSFEHQPGYGTLQQVAVDHFVDRFVAPPGVPLTSRPFGWRVVPARYGVFWLREFDPSHALDVSVARFFATSEREQVPNIVIDVQRDPGGLESVAQDFITALVALNVSQHHVYVLTDWGSFSASVLLAEDIVGDGFGTVVGQPTGEDLDVNGEQSFSLPDTGIWYQVATHAPENVLGYEAVTLRPSIPVALTTEDIQNGVNAVATWLKRLPSTGARN